MSTYGVVLFDNALPGAGWACLAGKEPFRIRNYGDLSTDAIWWSNIDHEDYWELGMWTNGWMRQSGFLRATMGAVLGDWGISREDASSGAVSNDETVKILADCFGRVMVYVHAAFPGGRPKLRGPTLAFDLTEILPPSDVPAGEAESAVAHSIQEWSRAVGRAPKDSTLVALRRPRLAHATEMLATQVPVGPWTFIPENKMPAPDKRVAWLLGLGAPCLTRITLKNIQPDVASLLAYGAGARDNDGHPLRRSWVADPELQLVSRFANVHIDAAWLATSRGGPVYEMPNDLKRLIGGPSANVSWSAGLFAENLWISAVQKIRKRGGGKIAPFRAAWVRAMDRVRMFESSLHLHDRGHTVTGYGVGATYCAVQPDMVIEVVRDGLLAGLVPPLSATMERPFDAKPSVWKGAPVGIIDALLRARGRKDMLWELDVLPTLAPERQAQMLRVAASKIT